MFVVFVVNRSDVHRRTGDFSGANVSELLTANVTTAYYYAVVPSALL